MAKKILVLFLLLVSNFNLSACIGSAVFKLSKKSMLLTVASNTSIEIWGDSFEPKINYAKLKDTGTAIPFQVKDVFQMFDERSLWERMTGKGGPEMREVKVPNRIELNFSVANFTKYPQVALVEINEGPVIYEHEFVLTEPTRSKGGCGSIDIQPRK